MRIVRSRHGAEYHYYGYHSGAPRIQAEPYTEEYWRELASFRSSEDLVHGDNLARLISEYKRDKLPTFAKDTHRDYMRAIERIEERWTPQRNPLRIKHMMTPDFIKDLLKWRSTFADRPRTADFLIEVFRQIVQPAVLGNLLPRNPLAGHGKLHKADHADVIWDDHELETLMSAATDTLKDILTIAAYTGIRQGDICRLSWSHIHGNQIRFRTHKRKSVVIIPILPPVREVIDRLRPQAEAEGRLLVLINGWKRPWTPDGIRSSFWNARDVVKIDKRFHDLRGTAATKLYRAGLDVEDIAKIFGWAKATVQDIIDIYVGDQAFADRVEQKMQGTPRAVPR